MENLSCHSGKILTYLSICLFYLFSLFAGSGVAARTPRREQAEGETSLRPKLLFWKLFLTSVAAMTNSMTPPDKCWRIGINRGGYKESIKIRKTAGTFGRAFSPCEWIFWNVSLFSISIERKPSKIAHLMAFYTMRHSGKCLMFCLYIFYIKLIIIKLKLARFPAP